VIRVRPPSAQWPFDLARWAFEATVRGGLPTEEPEILRFLGGIGWRFERGLTPARARLTADEVRRTFGLNVRTTAATVREAQDLALQARMESLVLPRMDAAEVQAIVRVQGALAPPAVVLFPHAGNLLLLAAALAWKWPGLVVFGARGLPPPGIEGVGAVRRTRINRHLAQRRSAEESRLPVRWEDDPAALPGWLARGHLVAAAFDDRAWRRYERVSFLGRPALLSPEPFALARDAGVPLLPATIRRERDKSSRVVLGPPSRPDLVPWLAEHAEPFLRAHPGHYASWLAECRMRAGMDDHPLFLDYAGGR
jgi:lauroyl/myristoyl acyltransferase